jgi:hypothetical protein
VQLSTHDWGLICLGGLAVVILASVANGASDSEIVPDVQTEAQFSGLGLDVGGRVNVGTNVSLDPTLHFWHPGLDPVPNAQQVTTLPVRYPYVSGGNGSTIMHRGFDALAKGSPDNCWRTFPPSEVSL